MSSAPRPLSDRARAIIEAAEASARPGRSARPGALPAGLPVTPPRRRLPAQPLLRAVEPARRPAPAATPVAEPAPAVDAAAVAAIPDPERLLALIQRIALQAGEIRRRLDVLSEAVGRVEADVLGTPEASTLPDEPVTAVPFEPVAPPQAPVVSSPVVVPPAVEAPPVPEAPMMQAPAAAPARPVEDPPSETARLVAIEMAVGGASRAEARARLTDEFGIRDADRLLDDVFGPGSDGGSRMRWT